MDRHIPGSLTSARNGRRNRILPHYGQLIVPRWQLKTELSDADHSFTYDLLFCIANGFDDPDYKMRLFSASSRLYYLSRLIYKSKKGFTKLPDYYYEKALFENYMESEKEIIGRLPHVCKSIDKVDSAMVFQCVQALRPLVVRWVSCIYEQMYIYEFAYLIDYVIQRKGQLPYPEDGYSPKTMKILTAAKESGMNLSSIVCKRVLRKYEYGNITLCTAFGTLDSV